MKVLLVLFIIHGILLLISSTNFAQTKSLYYQSFASLSDSTSNDSSVVEDVPIPSINAGDIVPQLLLGPISGLIFSIGGGFIGALIDGSGHDGPSLGVVIGALAGYSFGSAIGVYAAAKEDKYDADLLALIGSSLIGEVAGIYLYILSNNNPNVLQYAPIALPPIFAIITLNAFQQKETNITIGFDIQQLPQPNAYSYGMKLQYAF